MRFSALRIRAVHEVRRYFCRGWDVDVLTKLDYLPPFVRRHLNNVYFSLLCALPSSAFGSYLRSTGAIGNLLAVLGALMSIVCFNFLAPWKDKKRLCLLTSGAFFGGASLSPWLVLFLNVDVSFVVTSLLATSVGFGCFWAISKWTRRFDLMYFRALLLCSPLVLACLLVASSVFGGHAALWKFQLWPAILWFMVYVAAYSQEVAHEARRGNIDYVKHAIRLYTDFPAVALHVIRLLIQTKRRRNRR